MSGGGTPTPAQWRSLYLLHQAPGVQGRSAPAAGGVLTGRLSYKR